MINQDFNQRQREQRTNARREQRKKQRLALTEGQTSSPIQQQNNTHISHFERGESSRQEATIYSHVNEYHRRRRHNSYYNAARSYMETNTQAIHMLRTPTLCRYCQGIIFYRESAQICCMNGKIKLQHYTSPSELFDLFNEQTQEGRHFRQYIRLYNNAFAFTSMGVHYDENLAGRDGGVYTFRAHGAIYHRIGSLLPASDSRPRYAQSYMLDTDHEIQTRMLESDALHVQLVQKIQYILQMNNPFVQVLRQLGQRDDIPTCKLIIKQQAPNMHQYSLPTTSQVAAIIVDGDHYEDSNPRDIIVQTLTGVIHNIPDIAGYYDPLQYVMLLPYGSYGWDVNTRSINGGSVSCREFYAFMLQIRQNNTSLLLRGGRLLQQYVVDTYIKIETQRLRWYKEHQHTIRADLYKGLQDYFSGGENDAANVGRKSYVLPSTFNGSNRDQHQRYQDSMALVHHYRMPDLMITITCNQNWKEIKEQLLQGQSPQDRPDLLSRIFKAKLEEFKHDIIHNGVLGKVVSYSYVVEYQKRGLPHAHMLIILAESDKLRNPDEYDKVVRAEIPSKVYEPLLYASVLKHMIHGPHDSNDRQYPCMKNGYCRKRFPKEFCGATRKGNDSYPIYRRRSHPPVHLDSNYRKMVDNSWVVPYNPWLLLKYDCHINVEVTSSISCVNYLYKYVYKGHDRCMLEVRRGEGTDEIQQFVDGRWISAPEAMWHIFNFEMSRMYPSVYRLSIHLPNCHTVRFAESDQIGDILENVQNTKTTLTEFFVKNRDPLITGLYLYRQFPEHFVWNSRRNEWTQRVAHNKVIGRIYTVSPNQGEKFYLRILLNHVKGPTSFEDLCTVNSEMCSSYKEAAERLGLLECSDYVRQTLEEASQIHMPSALRRLFVSLLVYCNPTGVRDLWVQFSQSMLDDQIASAHVANVIAINGLLTDIDAMLQNYGKSVKDYDLPNILWTRREVSDIPKIILEELQTNVSREDVESVEKLNPDQLTAYGKIMEKMDNGDDSLFFIDGPGGTGKTFLYRVLLANVRARGTIALAVASSGIAATGLPGGRTAHSRFKIPLRPDEDTHCMIDLQSDVAELMRWVKLIVWDEAPMTSKYAFETLDKTLQDIMKNNVPFGGKIVVLGGDFRQVLPIVKKGNRCQQVSASISRSRFWDQVIVLRLRHNMRAIDDIQFSQFLLRIGDGRETTFHNDYVKLPDNMVLPWEGEHSIIELINSTFPNIEQHVHDSNYMVTRAIITPKNTDVDKLNDMIIGRFPGEKFEYTSWDTVEDDVHNLYQPEFLNSLCPSGLPPNKLILKIGTPIMLLRNLEPQMGLCNGTRLICRNLTTTFIDAELITGHCSGKRIFLHRMPLNSEDNSGLPFVLKRYQFPVRVSFALTINKSQGQTIPNIGIFLRNNVFGHGQLYVALSRSVSANNTKLLVREGKLRNRCGVFTKNIVYTEVLLP